MINIQWRYNGTEDYGTARALFAQTLDLFIFWALRDTQKAAN